MPLFEIFIYALALSMDAFAVAISAGLVIKRPSKAQYSRIALAFGVFQFGMTFLGYLFASAIVHIALFFDVFQKIHNIQSIASSESIIQVSHIVLHFIANALLLIVGFKMAKDSFKSESDTICQKDPSKGFSLIVLAFATSIDAFVIGLSLNLLSFKNILLHTTELNILNSSLIIGFVCAGLSILGVKLGTFFSRANVIGERAELLGGVTLMGIAFYNFFS